MICLTVRSFQVDMLSGYVWVGRVGESVTGLILIAVVGNCIVTISNQGKVPRRAGDIKTELVPQGGKGHSD